MLMYSISIHFICGGFYLKIKTENYFEFKNEIKVNTWMSDV